MFFGGAEGAAACASNVATKPGMSISIVTKSILFLEQDQHGIRLLKCTPCAARGGIYNPGEDMPILNRFNGAQCIFFAGRRRAIRVADRRTCSQNGLPDIRRDR